MPGTPLTPHCPALAYGNQQSLLLWLTLSSGRGKSFTSSSVAAFQKTQVALTNPPPGNKSMCREGEATSGQAEVGAQQEGHQIILADATSDKAAVDSD